MKKMKKMIYLAVGLVLCIATLATGTYGLSDRNIEIYKRALDMEKEVEESTFQGYCLSQFPVAFYDGEHDYVVTGSAEDCQVEKRKPVFDVFVGTAYEAEDHYEVLLPTIEKFSRMFELLNTTEVVSAGSAENTVFEENTYGDEEHIATMYHEGFHAFQMTNFEENIIECLKGRDFDEGGLSEQMIVEQVDHNTKLVEIYEKQLALLKKMMLSDSMEEIKKDLLQYKSNEEKRKALLPEDVLILEEYYERVEGTAFYVESTVYGMMHTKEEYDGYYIEPMAHYTDGSQKYYKIGMAKCKILDKFSEDWKENYDFSESLTDLLYEQVL